MLAHSSAFHAAEARASLPRKWLLGFDSPRSEAEEALGESESVEPRAARPEGETLGEARGGDGKCWRCHRVARTREVAAAGRGGEELLEAFDAGSGRGEGKRVQRTAGEAP